MDRIDRVLDVVARAEIAPTLTEVVQATGLPRSTTADLVSALRRRGYLHRSGTRYSLGRRLQVLVSIAGGAPAAPIDHRRLVALSRTARAPLALAVLVGGQVLYLDTAGPRAPQRLQQVADDHRPRPALRTAAGRLLLATTDAAQRVEVLRAVGESDPEAVEAFAAECHHIQHLRRARSDGLADPGIRAIAVPVFEGGVVAAALVVLGPRSSRHTTSHAWLALERAAARVVVELEGGVGAG